MPKPVNDTAERVVIEPVTKDYADSSSQCEIMTSKKERTAYALQTHAKR